MKRSISLSELRESLGEDVALGSPTASGGGATMRRASFGKAGCTGMKMWQFSEGCGVWYRSYENFASMTPRSGASTPPVTGGKVRLLSSCAWRPYESES
eukprot:2915377-Rhodomonas_salina.3